MKTINILIAALAFLILFGSCESFNIFGEKPSKNILIDPEIDVGSQSVAQSGGTITFTASGSEVDGMSIKVPTNSYASTKTFKISIAKISSHKLGDHFKPITPLIYIENGGGYSEKIMELTIPISLPAGHFAMGFFYDEATGRVEGIPVIELTPTSITLGTRHFMAANEWRQDQGELKSSPVDFSKASKIVISAISEATLQGVKTISTGFKPGTDDFEFVNYGSYIAPNGHCAGQSISMMYYYYERTLKGSDPLHGTYQMLDNIWQDNPHGFKLSSVVQNDLQWDGKLFKTLREIRVTPDSHYLSWYSFAYSMLVSGSPQYVGLTSNSGGHAIVAHKIALDKNILYVTDPNYPGQERQIKFENNKFSPYSSEQNMNEINNSSYTGIGYTAVSALIDWDKVAGRFKEFDAKTIGTIAPNTFPNYTAFVVKKAQNDVLRDGYSIQSDTLRCYISCPSAEMFYEVNNEKRIGFEVYNEEGQKVSVYERAGVSYVLLKPGKNLLGFYVLGWRSGKVDKNNNDINYFVDFKWMNIYYSSLSIDPNPIVGEPKKDIVITALPKGSAPKNVKYIWDFGDGTKPVTVNNDSIVKHKFNKEGDYMVEVQMIDASTDKLMGFATAEAKIASGILGELQKCQWVSIDFNASIKSNNEIVSFSVLMLDNEPPLGSKEKHAIKWSGTSFSVSYEYSYRTLLDDNLVNTKGTISGEVSANGLEVKSINGTQTSIENNEDKWLNTISAKNIPYNVSYEYNEYSPRFTVKGSNTKNSISSYDIRWDYIDSDGKPGAIYVTGTDYNDPNDEPYINVTFYGKK